MRFYKFVLALSSAFAMVAWPAASHRQIHATEAAQEKKQSTTSTTVTTDVPRGGFRLEALVDFVDDAIDSPVPITAKHVDGMMQCLKELGVRRVSWAYYGDGHAGYSVPSGLRDKTWLNLKRTYEELGNPLKVAVESGHRHGLEVYGYYKPYETGPAVMVPEGSPEAKRLGGIAHKGGSLVWLDPFVVRHPELRIQHRDAAIQTHETRPAIRTICLKKRDAMPTRITQKKHPNLDQSR